MPPGRSQPRLAGRIGYTKQYVSLAERPQRGLPSAALVQAIDDALGAGGVLVALHEQAEAARQACRSGTRPSTMAEDATTTDVPAPDAPTGRGPGQAPDCAEMSNAERRNLVATVAVAPEILNQALSEAADEALLLVPDTGLLVPDTGGETIVPARTSD